MGRPAPANRYTPHSDATPDERERDVFFRDVDLRIIPRAKDAPADADDTIEIALSSESPVERFDWWTGETYTEVLDHSRSSVDLAYAADGLPLLLDHSTREQIGIIENVRVDGDRVMRGHARFSRSGRASEVKQDVLDGIRKKISVGYRILKYEKERAGDDKLATHRATRWMPLEGSIVPIPADYSVGVGRAADGSAIAKQRTAPRTAHRQEQSMSGTATQERTREDETRDIVGMLRSHNMTDRLADVLERGMSAEQVRVMILNEYQHGSRRQEIITPPNPDEIFSGIADRERRQYSICRAILDVVDNRSGGYEREVSAEIARRAGRKLAGNEILVPFHALAPKRDTRTLSSIGAGTGQELKFTEHGGFIEALRNRARVGQLGARMLSGLQGPLSFTKQSGVGTAQWMAENPGSGVTPSDQGTALVAMSAKTLMAQTQVTRQLIVQSVIDVESMIQNDLAAIHALAIDLAAIAGTGAANQPTGLLSTSGLGSVAIGANGGVPTYDHQVDLTTAVKNVNGNTGTMGFLTTPGIEGKLRKTQEFSGTNGRPVWTGGDESEVVGFRALSSNQVPSNLVKGTSTDCHAILFGVWSELVIGMWSALQIIVDPYTQAGKALIVLTSFQMVDIAVRYPQSFAKIVDARVA
jgi:HK97 family phage major capsid protein